MKTHPAPAFMVLSLIALILSMFILLPAEAAATEKNIHQLNEELNERERELDALVSRKNIESQPEPLHSTLTPADTNETGGQEGTGFYSLFSQPSEWIPLAMCAVLGIMLFISLSTLMRKLINGRTKDDFIK
jgi:hypothetical protein